MKVAGGIRLAKWRSFRQLPCDGSFDHRPEPCSSTPILESLHPIDYLIELDDTNIADKPVARQTSFFADFEKLLPTQLENLTERIGR